MTALAIVCFAGGILVASDGAGYAAGSGELIAVKSKVELYPEKSCVIACRGVGLANVRVKEWLDHHLMNTFEELLGALPEAAREVHRGLSSEMSSGCRFSLFVGGWSEIREQFETYVLRTRQFEMPKADGGVEVVPPYELRPLQFIHLAPKPSDEASRAIGFTPPDHLDFSTFSDDKPFDAAGYAVRAICAARLDREDIQGLDGDDGPRVHSVGAFVQLTIVERDRIETRIMHRWPDRIGDRIDARVGDPLPAYLGT